ncbi:MAG TPA: penicillin acylase family protein [Stellaceae bacterium]|nr:penicillin acylase family protein [Stellaceae bacterium]
MIRRLLVGLLIAVILAAGAGWFYLRSSLPQVEGSITVKGLSAPVTIARDAAGVPLITAANDDAAAFGLGFAHAQDRLFQMELMRRYGAGRLAEVLGPALVPVDRQMRVLGLYRAAEAEWPHLLPEVQRLVKAYTAGVNAFLATRSGALPPEFLLLRFRPAPWKPADTLVWGKLMDLILGGNYRDELERALLARTVSPADMAMLYPGYPKGAPTTLAQLAPIFRRLPLRRLYGALPAEIGPTYASNNWVVDGAHSASGMPLVANDPHLAFGAPGFWYLARLKTPQREIDGATVAGTPYVVIGHNDRIAWGFTTTTADIEDLFIEKVDPADPSRYLTPNGTAPFVTRKEVIKVRGASPVVMTVRSTRHGPVLSDALPPGTTDPGYVLALQTTFLGADDESANALWGIDRARDWEEFRAALGNFLGPPQNIAFGDVNGTIGFIVPGHIPIRRKGDGWMPVPGWTGEYDWRGTIPYVALPQASNPRTGYFASANNKIVPDSYPYFVSRDWDVPYRIERIDALLKQEPQQTPDSSTAIEADTLSLMARQLVPLMTRAAPRSTGARDALQLLRHWDFRMAAGKPEPLIFIAWLREFARSVFFDRLGPAAAGYWRLRPLVIEKILTDRQDWCASRQRPHETCETRLADALEAALAELRQAYGPDMAKWRWGKAHIAEFPNRILDRIPLVRDWFGVAIPKAGGPHTVDVGAISVRDDKAPFIQRFGAGLRIITDLAHPDRSRMIVAPGQSGNPLSPHYADLLTRWRDFGWLQPARAQAVATLTLEPAR